MFTVSQKNLKSILSWINELMGMIEEHERKKYLMVNDYVSDKVLGKIKDIRGIEKFHDTKILIDMDDELPGSTLKNAILMTCIIKDDGKFYAHLFLKEALLEG